MAETLSSLADLKDSTIAPPVAPPLLGLPPLTTVPPLPERPALPGLELTLPPVPGAAELPPAAPALPWGAPAPEQAPARAMPKIVMARRTWLFLMVLPFSIL